MPPKSESSTRGPGRLIRHLAPLIVAAIPTLDTFGLLDRMPWLKDHLITATLVVIAVILELAILHREDLEKIETSVEELRGHGLNRVESEINALKSDLNREPLEKLYALRKDLDPKIAHVIGPYLDENFDPVVNVFRKQIFELSSEEKFRNFYKETLAVFPKAEFVATSIPLSRFFWRGRGAEQAMADFIRHGGKMKRIFFLEKPEQIEDPEVNEILRRQKEIGVDVYTLPMEAIPLDWGRRFFVVDTQGNIGWELTATADWRISRARLIWNHEETQRLLELHRKLSHLDAVRPFEGGRHPDPNVAASGARDEQKFKEYEERQWQKESVVEAYHHYFGKMMKQTAGSLLDTINSGANASAKKVLDIATGPGYLAGAAHQRGFQTTGIDYSDAAISLAKRLYPAVEQFRVSDAERSGITDESFDIAVINFGIMHFARPEAAIREAYRVLAKGGKFGFTVWSRDESAGIGVAMRALEAHEDPNLRPPAGPPFFGFSDPDVCRESLANAGFINIVVSSPHELIWEFRSGEDLFRAFQEGTARIGGRIRMQDEATQREIRETMKLRAAKYLSSDGRLRVPMGFYIVSADRSRS